MVNKAKRLSGINTLAYMGIEPITAPLLLVEQRIPTTDDRAENQIGALWILGQTDTVPARIFLLVRLQGSGPSGTATWIELQTGGTGPGVDFVTTDDGNTAVPVFGNLNVFGGLTDRGGINALNMTTYNDPAGSDNVFIALQESVFLPDTTDINNGVIGLGGTADGNRFMHNYGANGGVDGNTFVGATAGNFTLTGVNLTGIGASALSAITSGSVNTAVGFLAGGSITAGNNNVTIGSLSGTGITTGSDNVTIGAAALGVVNNSEIIAIGTDALALYTSARAVAVGHQALNTANLADNLTAVGWHAGFNATTVSSSTFIGANAGATCSGIRNVFVGQGVGQAGCSGAENTGLGTESLLLLTSGTNNTAAGRRSLDALLTGSNNIGLGRFAGTSYTGAESSNIVIGNGGTAAESNTIRLGTNGAGAAQQNRCFIGGIRGATTGVADAIAVLIDSAHQLGTVSSSARYKDNIEDMAEESSLVMDLRPVVFTYKNDEQKRIQYGLIAEEVEKVMPRLVVYDEDGLPQSVRYNDLPQILLNELKKLEKRVAHLEGIHQSCKHIC